MNAAHPAHIVTDLCDAYDLTPEIAGDLLERLAACGDDPHLRAALEAWPDRLHPPADAPRLDPEWAAGAVRAAITENGLAVVPGRGLAWHLWRARDQSTHLHLPGASPWWILLVALLAPIEPEGFRWLGLTHLHSTEAAWAHLARATDDELADALRLNPHLVGDERRIDVPTVIRAAASLLRQTPYTGELGGDLVVETERADLDLLELCMKMPSVARAAWVHAGGLRWRRIVLRRDGERWADRTLVDLRQLPPPTSGDEQLAVAAEALATGVDPHAASWVDLNAGFPRPTPEGIRRAILRGGTPILTALAKGHHTSDLLRKALDGWDEGVDAAAGIPDAPRRLRALLALGAPAAKHLASTVEAYLSGDERGSVLVEVVDRAPTLRLPFWEKQIRKPKVLSALHGSERLRAAWTFRPQPLVHALRAAAKEARWPDAACALDLLRSLHPASLHTLDGDLLTTLRAVGTVSRRHAVLIEAARGDERAVQELLDAADAEERLTWAVSHPLAWRIAGRSLDDVRAALGRLFDDAGEKVAPDALCPEVRDLLADVLCRAIDEAGVTPPSRGKHDLLDALEHELLRLSPERWSSHPVLRRRIQRYSAAPVEEPAAARARDLLVPLLAPFDHLHLAAEVGELWASMLDVGALELVRAALVAQAREHLGDGVLTLDRTWPTRASLTRAVPDATPASLDRCADEFTPPIFRAAMRAWIAEDPRGKAVAQRVFRDVWSDAPELLARHLLAVIDGITPRHRDALAVTLVALREPVGTKVPDALTRLAHAADGDDRTFLLRQRDTFNREDAGRQRARPALERTAEAWHRLVGRLPQG